MRRSLNYRFKEVAVAVVLGCLVSGAVDALSNSTGDKSAFAISMSVNRINKGDRLPSAPVLTQRYNTALSPKTIERRPRLGCDQAFSPIADPTRANIVKRCMV